MSNVSFLEMIIYKVLVFKASLFVARPLESSRTGITVNELLVMEPHSNG